jgi:uncharacterized protein (TIGR03437 family)
VYADPYAQRRSSNITVQFGETTVNEAVSVTPASAPILSTPDDIEVVFGQQISFTVSAVDPAGLAVVLSASHLPAGASFDPRTGGFSWTPAQSQQGNHHITFTATNSATVSSTDQLAIAVDSGKPFIASVHNAASWAYPACSPGSLASLAGRWLAWIDTPVSNPSGAAAELGGTRVKVNGEYVSLVYASPNRIDFVCPRSDPGTPLIISAENKAGIADPMSTTMYQAALGLYSVDGTGSGQGMITLAGTSLLATSRDYLALGQPAEPGDSVTIRATGIGTLDSGSLVVKIGDLYAQVQSVQVVPGVAGVYEITVEVPLGIEEGDAIPVVIGLPPGPPVLRRGSPQTREFRRLGAVTIAVERSR